jgi:hypothetical protein
MAGGVDQSLSMLCHPAAVNRMSSRAVQLHRNEPSRLVPDTVSRHRRHRQSAQVFTVHARTTSHVVVRPVRREPTQEELLQAVACALLACCCWPGRWPAAMFAV